ncbi:helix-turn-helix domain-containing protein [Larkinella soli]|uniref:helix-turn-helix domain-containing protein n=1 Tax=Larkinella soli TaxID=1770527 RepID=UPI000FFBE4AE|nr:helix-turn-helix transcriptional regulator [Larkinella soli]
MKILPVHLDLFALIILLGIAQGIFLGVFFLTGERRRNIANRCMGWMMLALSAITAEIFLNYTNYMFRMLEIVDFSEPFNFLPAPFFYLFTYSRIHRKLPRRWGLHLIPFAIWLVNMVTWLYQPIEFKYNSYIYSHHPELPFIDPVHMNLEEDFTGLRDLVSEMTLLSCLVYAVAGILLILRSFRRLGEPFWSGRPLVLAKLRNLSLIFLAFPFLIMVVKPQYYHDLGDYLLACYVTLIIYATSLSVMSGSAFFRDEVRLDLPSETESDTAPVRKKYEKSALSDELEENLLGKLTSLLDTEKPFLESDLSLPRLAQRLNTSPHHLSQLINDRLGQSFFDLLATYRVREAQRLLQHPDSVNLKIDEIAERVGYNSTSAFHTAFKRLTGQTPAQFRAAATSSRSA